MMGALSLSLAVPADLNRFDAKIRVVGTQDQPMIVLADICRVLELGNPAMVAERLDADEKGISQIDTLGGRQNMACVTEPGLYSVVLRSDKPNAKPFRRWVCHEVLPCIRNHGAYPAPAAVELRPASVAERFLLAAQIAVDHDRRIEQLEQESRETRRIRDESLAELNALPLSEDPAPEKPYRAKINELAKNYGKRTGNYAEPWRKLDHEMYYRCRINVRVQMENSGLTRLEVIERAGLMKELYDIASEILGPPVNRVQLAKAG